MKTFFIAGNKRSGTSQLVRLLNLHPQLYISHESDIIWILYKFYKGEKPGPYYYDSPKGMEYTLEKCGHLLDKNKTPQENFYTIQKHLMELGSPWLTPMKKEGLVLIGDKKPFQYADPEIVSFILKIFPDACFIHLIRHPFAVIQSVEIFKRHDGDVWLDLSPEQQIDRWTMHEKWVLDLKKRASVLDIRYEDLCRNTAKEIERTFEYLGLKINSKLLEEAVSDTEYVVKNHPKIKISADTKAILDKYGYKPNGLKLPKNVLKLINNFLRIRKTIIKILIMLGKDRLNARNSI